MPIARAAAGSARDAESLLDQALAHATGPLTAAGVESVLGGSPFDARIGILDAIAAEDVAGALTGLAGLLESGHDARRIAEDLLRTLRDAFLLSAGRGQVHVDAPEDEQERLTVRRRGARQRDARPRRSRRSARRVVDMRGTDAADPRLVLEIALVRLARRDTGGPLQVLADRVDRLEQRLASGAGAPPSRGGAGRDTRAGAGHEGGAGKKPALGAFKQAPTAPPPAEHDDLPPRPPPSRGWRRHRPRRRPSPAPAAAPDGEAPEKTFDLDDVIVAWARCSKRCPGRCARRSRRRSRSPSTATSSRSASPRRRSTT